MKKSLKSISLIVCVFVLCVSLVNGCGSSGNKTPGTLQNDVKTENEESEQTSEKAVTGELPKYVFLFIGDGMSYPQIQSASYYLGAIDNEGSIEDKELSFMSFPVLGSVKTYDSTSFCPDSASSATAIATGNKTSSGTINMDTTLTKKYETIAEKLKKQLGYKIGVLTTVNLNHATPAAFYAHQESRNNYYEIGEELVDSGFDYFAGGAFIEPTGENENQKSLYDIAEGNGYQVIQTEKEAEGLTTEKGKAIVIAETLADSDSLNYSIDAQGDEWNLADYVKKGIEVLENEKGFFMMVEGGKVDWACHANDAATSIHETIGLSNAVENAMEFYKKHPDETLIIVTADHETGGLSIGYAGTNYDTHLVNLEKQKISFAKFNQEYIAKYKESKTDFATVLKDIKDNFGLMTGDDVAISENSSLVLTEYEVELLEEAYNCTLSDGAREQENMTQKEYELYGTCEPLTVTITHILDNKSGISYNSYSHTGLSVPVYAIGCGSEQFGGYYNNTDIYNDLADLTGVSE